MTGRGSEPNSGSINNTSLISSLGYTIYYRGYYRKKNSCTCNDTMEIQTLIPGKCSLILDVSRIA
jgi:hypothetical protein